MRVAPCLPATPRALQRCPAGNQDGSGGVDAVEVEVSRRGERGRRKSSPSEELERSQASDGSSAQARCAAPELAGAAAAQPRTHPTPSDGRAVGVSHPRPSFHPLHPTTIVMNTNQLQADVRR
ncbi:hypothetical protein PHYPSEUDO_004161 [Phytophthora pseudosyringae]|uniref:Uncharacterized protein n=1 Tax=Phytophthora pseudosyringae TaxID=221518 RepID=A0A8T1WIY0_9STRA|nr:hypothetical protein PHYPSEUDO_004161 [Phytophthora pseudosyringae]